MLNNEDKQTVEEMIKKAVDAATKFSKRKVGDTPTDDNQLTPKGYVNLSGLRADRPTSPARGQQYFSTQDMYPWFTDGVSSWFSATGSVVSAL